MIPTTHTWPGMFISPIKLVQDPIWGSSCILHERLSSIEVFVRSIRLPNIHTCIYHSYTRRRRRAYVWKYASPSPSKGAIDQLDKATKLFKMQQRASWHVRLTLFLLPLELFPFFTSLRKTSKRATRIPGRSRSFDPFMSPKSSTAKMWISDVIFWVLRAVHTSSWSAWQYTTRGPSSQGRKEAHVVGDVLRARDSWAATDETKEGTDY
ncbi:hypothetical protein N7G274_005473 [Stereocaulon virgatum]|uniref:Uncharacterized protein n=1 Tax=Stereocaulon virgatum TaxID=373712 RepID=A0ABR4AAD2_9LECA